jgi:hypothetical protein
MPDIFADLLLGAAHGTGQNRSFAGEGALDAARNPGTAEIFGTALAPNEGRPVSGRRIA